MNFQGNLMWPKTCRLFRAPRVTTSLGSAHSLRASVRNGLATAASAAEARTTKPAVRKTVGKLVEETRIAPRPDPAATAI